MRDIWEKQLIWIQSGIPFVLARVIQTWRSAPRKSGAGMLIGKGMKIEGSVSGGCIEGAVIEEAMEILENGKRKRLVFGVEDETALSVGLSCGGEVSILLEKHWAFSANKNIKVIWKALQNSISQNNPAVIISMLPDASSSSSEKQTTFLILPNEKNLDQIQSIDNELIKLAELAYEERENKVVEYERKQYFIQVFPRRDKLLIIGAGHITIPLVRFAKELDFITVVIDPRNVFADPKRFTIPPDKLESKWPEDVLPELSLDEDTYVILLTHDPKIDDPALHILLKNNLAYIGALGSKRTHSKRCARLKEAGFDGASIDRIKGPAGIEIGAQSAAEIALSMITEVVAVKHRKI